VTTALQTDPERDGVAAVGALLDRRVRPRAAFEAWISAPPYEREIERFGESSAWPGNYRDIDVDLAWNAWIDAVTMTRERCAQVCDELQAEMTDQGTASPYGDVFARRIRGA
jgi:hypothetical protein